MQWEVLHIKVGFFQAIDGIKNKIQNSFDFFYLSSELKVSFADCLISSDDRSPQKWTQNTANHMIVTNTYLTKCHKIWFFASFRWKTILIFLRKTLIKGWLVINIFRWHTNCSIDWQLLYSRHSLRHNWADRQRSLIHAIQWFSGQIPICW